VRALLNPVALAVEVDGLGVDQLPVLVEVFDEAAHASVELEQVRLRGVGAVVGDRNLQSLVQEGELAQPVGQQVEAELDALEDLPVRLEPHQRAVPVGLPDHLHRRLGNPPRVALRVDAAVLVDGDLHPLREGVHHRAADAVQAARDLVGALVELAPGVELGHHHFEGADLLGRMNVDRDAPAVVLDGDDVAAADLYRDVRAVSGQGLVDRVVHDLKHEVVEAVGTGRADVHARPLPHVLEALENLDAVGIVGVWHGRKCSQVP
jgi:hypothetical protein